MDNPRWTAVDRYLEGVLVGRDGVLEGALSDSAAGGLPSIQVTALLGKWLYLMALSISARRVLEIGTLGGYSAIWLGRAVSKVAGKAGRVVTVEAEARHAAIARGNISRAGLSEVVEVVEGKGLEVLPGLVGKGAFDLIFIDADKVSTAEYFEWAVKLGRVGALIVVDNVVRSGKVADEKSEDVNVRGVRRFFEKAQAEGRVEMTAFQVVGSKGWDGVAVGVIVGKAE